MGKAGQGWARLGKAGQGWGRPGTKKTVRDGEAKRGETERGWKDKKSYRPLVLKPH